MDEIVPDAPPMTITNTLLVTVAAVCCKTRVRVRLLLVSRVAAGGKYGFRTRPRPTAVYHGPR